VKTSDSIAQLAPALVAAQGTIKAVPKDGKNPAFRSKYATLDAIMEAVRPALAAQGLTVVQGVIHPETSAEGRLVGITVETRVIHSSGEWVASVVPVPVAKADAHGLGSALSYGRRYGISALLALTTDEDDDGNAAATSTNRSAPAPRRQEPPTAPEPGKRLHASVPETPREPMSLAKAEAVTMKGQTLGSMDDERLEKLLAWPTEKGNGAIVAACQTILAAREADDMADEMDQVLNLPNSLPF